MVLPAETASRVLTLLEARILPPCNNGNAFTCKEALAELGRKFSLKGQDNNIMRQKPSILPWADWPYMSQMYSQRVQNLMDKVEKAANDERFTAKWHDAQIRRKSTPYTVSAGNHLQLLLTEQNEPCPSQRTLWLCVCHYSVLCFLLSQATNRIIRQDRRTANKELVYNGRFSIHMG